MFDNPFHKKQTGDPFIELSHHDVELHAEEEEADSSDHSNIHDVEPHYVQDYVKLDGTHVEGYWRDGDGNTTHDLTTEEGGGYVQSNPDGDQNNNLG